MVIIKKSTVDQCWRGCGDERILLYRWWECKLLQPLWRTLWRFLKKLKIELPYDSAIPILGIRKDKNSNLKKIHAQVHCSIFTTTRTWRQPSHPLTGEWIEKMWSIYTMEYHSATKKEWNKAICSNMDGPRDDYTKWWKSEKDKYHSIFLTCEI